MALAFLTRGCSVIKRRAARLVGLFLVCVCAASSAATTRSAVAAEPLCDPVPFGFGVGLPKFPVPDGRLGGYGRIDLHNDVDLGVVESEGTRGGRVILRAALGEEPQVGDRFGAAIAIADIDGDRCGDVVVGAPGVDGRGAVYVIYGTRAGLGTGASMRIPFQASPGDAFGKALAVEAVRSPTTQKTSGRIWIG